MADLVSFSYIIFDSRFSIVFYSSSSDVADCCKMCYPLAFPTLLKLLFVFEYKLGETIIGSINLTGYKCLNLVQLLQKRFLCSYKCQNAMSSQFASAGLTRNWWQQTCIAACFQKKVFKNKIHRTCRYSKCQMLIVLKNYWEKTLRNKERKQTLWK